MSSFLAESNICFDRQSSRPSRFSPYNGSLLFPKWRFGEHLSRALPTKMIFYLPLSIRLRRVLRDYNLKSILDLLEIIIKWLKVSGGIYDRRTPTKDLICV